MKIEGKRVLITGGSSGIGLALAHGFLAKGARVVITGRRTAILANAIQALPRVDESAWSVTATIRSP